MTNITDKTVDYFLLTYFEIPDVLAITNNYIVLNLGLWCIMIALMTDAK